MIDLGTGNNNKINWAIEDKQEFIDIVGKFSNHSLIANLFNLYLAVWNFDILLAGWEVFGVECKWFWQTWKKRFTEEHEKAVVWLFLQKITPPNIDIETFS